jgi:hypothetical protein
MHWLSPQLLAVAAIGGGMVQLSLPAEPRLFTHGWIVEIDDIYVSTQST